MLGDTLIVTVGGGAQSLSKINQDAYSAEYLKTTSTAEYRLKISHSRLKNDPVSGQPISKHYIELTNTLFPAGVVPGKVIRMSTVLIAQDNDAGNATADAAGLYTWLSASSGAVSLAILGWQS